MRIALRCYPLLLTRNGVLVKTLTLVAFFGLSLKLHTLNIGYSPTFDFTSCQQLCGGSEQECYEREMTMVVYNEVHPADMTFKQMDQFYVRNRTLLDMIKITPLSNVHRKPRRNCPISDIDKAFSTLQHQRSCAIVGNSGILLNSGCGSVIDSHDFVMRANLAPVRGYIPDVGHKTNLMLLNDAVLTEVHSVLSKEVTTEDRLHLLEQLRYLNNTVLWYPKDATKHNGILRNISTLFRNERLEARLGFSLQDIYSVIKWKYNLWRYPSSGLYMLALAQALCKNVSIFGFYPYETNEMGQEVLRHYYEPDLKNFHTWAHDFDAEYRMLVSMRDRNILEMVTSRCVSKDSND